MSCFSLQPRVRAFVKIEQHLYWKDYTNFFVGIFRFYCTGLPSAVIVAITERVLKTTLQKNKVMFGEHIRSVVYNILRHIRQKAVHVRVWKCVGPGFVYEPFCLQHAGPVVPCPTLPQPSP